MIKLSNITKVFQQGNRTIQALNNVSLHVPAGQIYGVIGASGAGKSTLIRCVNLLERPTQGSVEVGGQELTALSEKELTKARRQIGMIFQDHHLLMDRTVFDNVAIPLIIAGASYDDIRRRVSAALDKVGLLDKAKNFPIQLSGGEQQRVALARAFNGRPEVLFADEPTGNLDRKTGDKIADLLFSLNREHGTTLILVTHDPQLAARCDRRLRLVNGVLQEEA